MSKQIIVMTIATQDAGSITIRKLVNGNTSLQRQVSNLKLAHCTRGKVVKSVQVLETSNLN